MRVLTMDESFESCRETAVRCKSRAMAGTISRVGVARNAAQSTPSSDSTLHATARGLSAGFCGPRQCDTSKGDAHSKQLPACRHDDTLKTIVAIDRANPPTPAFAGRRYRGQTVIRDHPLVLVAGQPWPRLVKLSESCRLCPALPLFSPQPRPLLPQHSRTPKSASATVLAAPDRMATTAPVRIHP